MRSRRNPWLRLALFSAAVGLFLLGYYWGNQYKRPVPLEVETAILLRPPLQLPAFNAVDQTGQSLTRERLIGRWSLLLIGSTGSQETHAGLSLITRIYNRLAVRPNLQDALHPILLSPDPEQDSTDRLLDTIHAYNPLLTVAAGSEQDLSALLTTLGSQAEGPATLYLVDPRGRTVALFTAHQDPAAIARDIQLILDGTTEN